MFFNFEHYSPWSEIDGGYVILLGTEHNMQLDESDFYRGHGGIVYALSDDCHYKILELW